MGLSFSRVAVRLLLCRAAALVVLCAVASADGAVKTNGAPAFVFSTHGIRLAELLRDLGANCGIPVVVSARIDGSFIGRIDAMPPEMAFDHLANLYRLAWYYD